MPDLTVDTQAPISLKVSGGGSASLSIGGETYSVDVDDYEGPYEIIPSGARQVIQVSGMKAVQDIVVDPIPSNYGLVTWDGSVLMVS